MIALLLRCYPARWRARYGDEFAAVLEDRPLGPFDVADVLLGALDAHMHLRGRGAASEHRKAFAMSLRTGGYAAVIGGLLWLFVLVGNAINDGADAGSSVLFLAAVVAMIVTLVALIGLSAFQARRHPLLAWAAFAIPAIGAAIGLLGVAGMATSGDTEVALIAGLSGWWIMSIGLITLLLGSGLFALATWRTRSLSRAACALLGVGALLVVPGLAGVTSGLVPPVLTLPVLLITIFAFPAGWVALGISALRVGRNPVTSMQGASL
ncbi:MAG: hypothetical protein ABIO99_11495 [Candidatus Limnocylindria bacterium]